MADKEQKDRNLLDAELDEAAEARIEDSAARKEPPVEKEAGKNQTSRLEDAPAAGDWFVDFDVWEATLESNFGPDFEHVLSNELGPDWATKLNSLMQSEKNFYRVIEDIKADVQGRTNEIVEVANEPGNITFETLGPGEVIYDASTAEFGVRGGGGGGRGEGGGGRGIPNLKDLRRKDFEVKEGLEPPKTDERLEENVIQDEDALPDQELVLMDRNEFSRMSYYAHKEMERHKDELRTKAVLGRESQTNPDQKASLLNRLLFWLSVMILLYAVFCITSYPVSSYYSKTLLEKLPPDFYFQPSNSLHKQGELTARSLDPAGGPPALNVIFFYRPAILRLEIENLLSGEKNRYDLSKADRDLIELAKGPQGRAVIVQGHYPQYLPTNASLFMKVPFLTLSEDGQTVLTAYERPLSGLLPGLILMDIVAADGSSLGSAYVAEDKLNIVIPGLAGLTPVEKVQLTDRLVLLFALLEV
ncbi:MAG: hypothetical protein V1794_00535 [Candidatus Glassbacteria bacterium]